MSYDDDRITPVQVIREAWSWVPVVFIIGAISFVFIGALTIAAWQLHWLMFSQSVNRQNNTYQNSYGTQQSDIMSMEQAVQAIPGAVDHAQVLGDVNTACAAGSRVNNLPPGDATWYADNCSGPAISAGSQYNSTDANGN